MRINKYLSSCGLCSRREADKIVADGRVRIDGVIAKAGDKVEDGMEVTVDGEVVTPNQAHTYLLFYKPRGIVCTSDRREKNNLIDYLQYPKRITYAGRLDKESEGLLLLTDDGDLIHAIMRAGDVHEKEYEVTTVETIRDEDLARMERGVNLPELSRTTRPCRVRRISDRCFRITLTEGINREIRRICAEFGYSVKKLVRVRLMDLTIEGLAPGRYRPLEETEIRTLLAQAFPERMEDRDTEKG